MGHYRAGTGALPLGGLDKEQKQDTERKMEREMGRGSGGEDREVGDIREAQREKLTDVFVFFLRKEHTKEFKAFFNSWTCFLSYSPATLLLMKWHSLASIQQLCLCVCVCVAVEEWMVWNEEAVCHSSACE